MGKLKNTNPVRDSENKQIPQNKQTPLEVTRFKTNQRANKPLTGQISNRAKNFLLDLFFPKFCLSCGKTGSWLCQDCQAFLKIQEENFCPACDKLTLNFKTHKACKGLTKLAGLFWAVDYRNPLVKKLIFKFKYRPFAKELARPLTKILISHFLLSGVPLTKMDFVLVPIPLTRKRLKWRGFNQAEEIAKEISRFYQLPLDNLLIREKERIPQMKIKEPEKRKENIKGVFSCVFPQEVRGKTILLIDDVSTTRATLEEAAKVLKKSGAQEVWAAVVARG